MSPFYNIEATNRRTATHHTNQWDPTLTGAARRAPFSCVELRQSFTGASNAPHCILKPSLPDTLPSHHQGIHAPSDTYTGKAGTCEIPSSRQKSRFPEVASADCSICHGFSKLISCFRETWNLWGERVNSFTIYAPLQIRNTDWNWHLRWPTPYISLTKTA